MIATATLSLDSGRLQTDMAAFTIAPDETPTGLKERKGIRAKTSEMCLLQAHHKTFGVANDSRAMMTTETRTDFISTYIPISHSSVVVSMALSEWTGTTSSIKLRSRIGGTKPAPMPNKRGSRKQEVSRGV